MLNSRFLQMVLWVDCNSGCAFCLNKRGLMNKDFYEDKIENINKAIEKINNAQPGEYDFVGIIGGEFFQGQITDEVAPHFIKLSKLIKQKIDDGIFKQLFVATSLMGPNNYNEFQKYFSEFSTKQILVCTSYNEFGQFNQVFTKNNWLNNFDKFLKNGYQMHIEMIASEANMTAIISEKLDLLYWVNNNVRIDFLRPISFLNEPKEKYPWFFPKRETFIKFMMFLEQHFPNMLDDFMSLKQRASRLYNFTFNQTVSRKEEFDEGEGTTMPCGHSEMFKAYIDSDRCMACDILAFYKRNKYRSPNKGLPNE